MTLVVCRALCGQVLRALPAAAAVEFFAASLDVFDDIEDQDNESALWRQHGQAQATNAATALLMLAQLALARTKFRDVDDGSMARAMETLASAGVTACAGQHSDLEYESNPFVTETAYFNMIRMKSASLVECASRLGAIVAGADDPTIESFGIFGRNLGIAAQISNDVHSISGQQSTSSDIAKKKKTLPVLFAMANSGSHDCDWLASVYRSDLPIEAENEKRVVDILRRSGAIQYCLVRAEMYRQNAVRGLLRAGIPDSVIRDIASSLSI